MGHKHSTQGGNAKSSVITSQSISGRIAHLGPEEPVMSAKQKQPLESNVGVDQAGSSVHQLDHKSKSEESTVNLSRDASKSKNASNASSRWNASVKPLQRAKSALPPSTQVSFPNHPVTRSKSLPNMGARRADINLGDDAMEEVSKLHSTFKEERSQKIDTESLTDSTLSDFEKRCQAFVFGSQKLSGVPGQERSKTGVTPAHISVSCIKGLKGLSDTSANQDNYSYYKYKDHELICVLDGHGPAGHHVSFRGIRTLPYFFSQSKHFPSNIPEALTEAYKKCHADLLTHSVERDFDIQVSGAACVMAVRYENKLWISNTGDSRIVLGDIQSGDVIAETNDHKPSDTSERNRLEAQGSEVQIFGFDNNVRIHRVFVRGTDYPGLCMSRSLGDQSVKEHGVIPVPDVKRIEIVPSKMFMVLASDGVWEFIPSKLVCSSLSKKLGSEGQDKCVARVVTEAKKRWKSNEGSYCDDITALLVVL